MVDQPSENISAKEVSFEHTVLENAFIENITLENLASEFVSAIKINSRSILPPVITLKIKEELVDWKKKAIIAETRLKMRKLAKEAQTKHNIPRYDYSRYITKKKIGEALETVSTLVDLETPKESKLDEKENKNVINIDEPTQITVNDIKPEIQEEKPETSLGNEYILLNEDDQKSDITSDDLLLNKEENENSSKKDFVLNELMSSNSKAKTELIDSHLPHLNEYQTSPNKLKSIENTQNFANISSEESPVNFLTLNCHNKENISQIESDIDLITFDNSEATDFDVTSLNTTSAITPFEDKSMNESSQLECRKSSVLDLISQYSFDSEDQSISTNISTANNPSFQSNQDAASNKSSIKRQKSFIVENPSAVLLNALKDGKISAEVPSLELSQLTISESCLEDTRLLKNLNNSKDSIESSISTLVMQTPKKINLLKLTENYLNNFNQPKKPRLNLSTKKTSIRKVSLTKSVPSKKYKKSKEFFGKQKLSRISKTPGSITNLAFKSDCPIVRKDRSLKDLSGSFESLCDNFQNNDLYLLTKKLESSRLAAYVKGYLTRRLFKTTRVCTIIAMIQRVLQNALQFQNETETMKTHITAEIVQKHQAFIDQINSSITELFDIFHTWPKKEQMRLIAQDRELKHKGNVTPHTKPKVSSATLKYRQRKYLKNTN